MQNRSLLPAIAVAASLSVGGCASGTGTPSRPVGRSATSEAHAVEAAAGTKGGTVIPLSVSFISRSVAWMLALPPCARRGCRTLLLRRTADGGNTWASEPAPPARLSFFPSVVFGNLTDESASGVNTVLFANASDGWIYGPGLLATRDGGRTWHKIRTHGLLVTRMGTGDGHIFAVFQDVRCDTAKDVCPSHLYAARVGSDSFRQIRGTVDANGITSSIVVSGRTAYVGAFYGLRYSHGVGTPLPGKLLMGPANASKPWHALKMPGPRGRRCDEFGMFLAAAGGRLALGCAGQPGGLPPGPMQHKWIYLSHTQGRAWRQVTSPPAIPGYMNGLSITADGLIVESGSRADVHLSWDGGRTWHTSPSLNNAYTQPGDAGLAATMVTNKFGFAIEGSLYFPQIYFTHDGGHVWTSATVN
jgi:hypothetical protein